LASAGAARCRGGAVALELVVGGHIDFDEGRHTVGAAPVHAVQHQAVQVDVQVCRRAEALDQRAAAAVAFVGLEPCAVQSMSSDHALHHMQHPRARLGMRGQQQAQRDPQRQHPLPHRHVRNDVVGPLHGSLRHPAVAARRAEPAALATEGQQFVLAALAAAQSQEAVRRDAALEEVIELILDEAGQVAAGAVHRLASATNEG
jgi:hypothetical protein